MDKIKYDQLDETLYHEKLDNGLSVYILPRPGFSKTYATFSTRYGSIDNHFVPPGLGDTHVTDGIAHFLEHKMFEEEEGDIFATFSAQGASANAYTSFTRTSYLFSATEKVNENLETLIDFVQRPYFTDENVEKEKGIIGQEIRMYEDNPDWRVYFGLIQSLYVNNPVQIDIAGTVESIAKIDKETLYLCYRTFYHPGNMLLFVVGAVDPEATMRLIKENQANKSFSAPSAITRIYPEEPTNITRPQTEIRLPVGIPKCLMGFKDKKTGISGDQLLRRELVTGLLFDVLMGERSDLYQKLYEANLIGEDFDFEYNAEEQFSFSVLGGDTRDPEALVEMIKKELQISKEKGIESSSFELSRKKRIGQFLRSLNSVEFVANQFTKYRFNDTDLFQILPLLEEITLEEVNERLQEHIDFDQFSVCMVKPLE